MNLRGKDAVLSLWNVQTYQEIWGTYGKAVDKARTPMTQHSKGKSTIICYLSPVSIEAAER